MKVQDDLYSIAVRNQTQSNRVSTKPNELPSSERRNRNGFLSILVALIITGCSSVAVPVSEAVSMAVGELELVGLAPESGSLLEEGSTLEATFEYRITNFQVSSRYGIAPVFADNRGAGRTFTSQERITDALPLSTSTGEAKLRYPIRREWNSGNLARPVEVSFVLLEENSSSIRVLSKLGPFIFRNSSD